VALLEVSDLTTYYRLKEGYVRACEGVSLRLEKGEALGLVGESASGKTTVALSLMKLLPANASIVGGSIKLDGRELVAATEEEMQKIRWKEISIIFQGAMNALNPVRHGRWPYTGWTASALQCPAWRRQAAPRPRMRPTLGTPRM